MPQRKHLSSLVITGPKLSLRMWKLIFAGWKEKHLMPTKCPLKDVEEEVYICHFWEKPKKDKLWNPNAETLMSNDHKLECLMTWLELEIYSKDPICRKSKQLRNRNWKPKVAEPAHTGGSWIPVKDDKFRQRNLSSRVVKVSPYWLVLGWWG